MIRVLLFPVKLLGLGVAGVALGAGWKLGSHLAEVGIGKSDILRDKVTGCLDKLKGREPSVQPHPSEASE